MSRKVLGWLAMLAVFTAMPVAAQVSPTPEGTVITNTVTVDYEDAEGNEYSANAQVSVTVGFKAGIDVTSAATVTPATPSTGNILPFTITNTGNGDDRFQVSNVTVGAGSGTLTITGYEYDGTTYPTLVALNAVLNGAPSPTDSIAAGDDIIVNVIYDLQIPGGTTRTITLTATSVRTPATTDASTTSISPPVAGGVSVTANNTTINRIPNNNTAVYTTTFLIANGSNAARNFDLEVTGVTGIAILSSNVTIVGGTTVNIPANDDATITVEYVVEDVARGQVSTITFRVEANDDPSNVFATATHQVTVIRPDITLEKQVYRQDQTTAITAAMRVLPGEDIYYKLTITNNGTAAATLLSLTDDLPEELAFVSHSIASGTWTVTPPAAGSSGTLTATTASLGIGASNVIWIRATVR